MKAGKNVLWKAKDNQLYKCKIIAVYDIVDAINKNVIGKTLYRLNFNGSDFHAFEEEIQLIK